MELAYNSNTNRYGFMINNKFYDSYYFKISYISKTNDEYIDINGFYGRLPIYKLDIASDHIIIDTFDASSISDDRALVVLNTIRDIEIILEEVDMLNHELSYEERKHRFNRNEERLETLFLDIQNKTKIIDNMIKDNKIKILKHNLEFSPYGNYRYQNFTISMYEDYNIEY